MPDDKITPGQTRIQKRVLDRAVAGAVLELGEPPYSVTTSEQLRALVEAALLAAFIQAPKIPADPLRHAHDEESTFHVCTCGHTYSVHQPTGQCDAVKCSCPGFEPV